jgi:hypothetical protein
MEGKLIYLLIAIGAGLYQWYKKAKEKEEQQKRVSKPVEPTQQPVDVEKMLEELLNPNKKRVVDAKPVVAEVKKPLEVKPAQSEFTGNEDAQKSADQAYDFDATRYYDEIKRKQNDEVAINNMSLEAQMSESGQFDAPIIPVVEERADNTNTNEWANADADDIRKAVIWNEILKRPAWAN